MKKITKEQYNELCYLMRDDIKAFNEKLEELFDVDVVPYTGYQYFYNEDYKGDSCNDTASDILDSLWVEIEKR